MARVENVKAVQGALERARGKYGLKDKPSVIVGYTQNYALHVHENLEQRGKGLPRRPPSKGTYWDTGEPKYLERPAREHRNTIAEIVRKAVSKGTTLLQALLLGGLRLQRESMKLVPVDTGALKASAFTKPDD